MLKGKSPGNEVSQNLRLSLSSGTSKPSVLTKRIASSGNEIAGNEVPMVPITHLPREARGLGRRGGGEAVKGALPGMNYIDMGSPLEFEGFVCLFVFSDRFCPKLGTSLTNVISSPKMGREFKKGRFETGHRF